MSYGFLDVTHASQRHGFFVDEQERILFWPSEAPVAYILSFEKAQKIAELRYIHQNGRTILTLVLATFGISLLAISFALLSGNNVFFGLFSILPFTGAIMTAPPIAGFVYWIYFGRPRLKRALYESLVDARRLERARPTISFLKPSEIYGRKVFLSLVFFLSLAMVPGFMASPLSLSEHSLKGDVIIFSATTIMFVFISINFVRLQLMGSRLCDIRLFDASKLQSPDGDVEPPD